MFLFLLLLSTICSNTKVGWDDFIKSSNALHSSNSPNLLKEGIDLAKYLMAGGMEKLLKGRGILRSVDAVSLGIFSSWNVANITINYIYY